MVEHVYRRLKYSSTFLLAGYLCTLYGRKRYFPELNSTNAAVKAHAERQAVNFPVQGKCNSIELLDSR